MEWEEVVVPHYLQVDTDIQVSHLAPSDTQGRELLFTSGQEWAFHFLTRPPLITLSMGDVDVPCYFSPCGFHSHQGW